MKFILPGFVVLTLAVAVGTEPAAVSAAAENPDVGRKREFRVVAVNLGELKRRVADAEIYVEECQERLAWAERMVRKGFFTRAQVAADRARLESAELALEKLRQTLKSFPPHPIGK